MTNASWFAAAGNVGLQVVLILLMLGVAFYFQYRFNRLRQSQEEARDAAVRAVEKEALSLAARTEAIAERLRKETVEHATHVAADLDVRMGELITRMDVAQETATATKTIVKEELKSTELDAAGVPHDRTTREQIDKIEALVQRKLGDS